MKLINLPKPCKSHKTMFELSTVALTNLTTFGVALGDTVLAVEVEVED